MAQPITVQLDLPGDLAQFRLPAAVDQRLHQLLNKQDSGSPLTDDERAEAQGLVDMAEALALLRLRAERAARDVQP